MEELEGYIHDPEGYLTVQVARDKMREWREERGADKKAKKAMSVDAIHKRKTIIVREINAFLSERSDLRAMILELKERDVTDFYYVEDIVEAFKEAVNRINKVLEDLDVIVPIG